MNSQCDPVPELGRLEPMSAASAGRSMNMIRPSTVNMSRT